MKRLILALQLMTRLPLPNVKADERDFAAAIGWFPATGIAVGGVVVIAILLGATIGPWVAALLGVIAWTAITGALHLDGLGDIADAAGAAHRHPERLREVLSDPHVGTFAVVVIALQLAAKLVLLKCVVDVAPLWPLVAVAFLARIGPLFWTEALPLLHDGLAARFHRVGWPMIGVWIAIGLLPGVFSPALLIAPVLWILWALWIKQRIGGISGDGHGAGIELVESELLLALVIAS
ncbi:adenosylcobinamide-GDP ribazoletransferase [Novosphingobium aquimarinum]|uniref:adenosylcobinamide-GDP ribazoletransferase n=1 Tax=Novosphingobium aquimarinum TaxID=2682494 RepID=UPI0012EC556B|nr:adenosylcobinamide-GDP ribazoletransferase [Novosphingobium aquimarinum]